MKRAASLIGLILCAQGVFADPAPTTLTPVNSLCTSSDKDLTTAQKEWRAMAFQKIREIKPGIRRKDIPKWLGPEGGVSPADQNTYLYSECPYIKVNVRFKAHRDAAGRLNESPQDIIESISKPYVQQLIVAD